MVIKEVGRGDEESRIARMLSSEPLKDDPKNHSVPILDVFDDPTDDSKSFLVMPLLRPADHPPFDHVKEIVDFVDQLLEVCHYPVVKFGFDLRVAGACFSAREWGGSSVTNNRIRTLLKD